MNVDIFENKKRELILLVKNRLAKRNMTDLEESSLIKVLDILDEYSFKNRFEKKGILAYTIVDSLKMDYSLCERLIKFDNDI